MPDKNDHSEPVGIYVHPRDAAVLLARVQSGVSGICAARRAIDAGMQSRALGNLEWLQTQLHAIDAWVLVVNEAIRQAGGGDE